MFLQYGMNANAGGPFQKPYRRSRDKRFVINGWFERIEHCGKNCLCNMQVPKVVQSIELLPSYRRAVAAL